MNDYRRRRMIKTLTRHNQFTSLTWLVPVVLCQDGLGALEVGVIVVSIWPGGDSMPLVALRTATACIYLIFHMRWKQRYTSKDHRKKKWESLKNGQIIYGLMFRTLHCIDRNYSLHSPLWILHGLELHIHLYFYIACTWFGLIEIVKTKLANQHFMKQCNSILQSKC